MPRQYTPKIHRVCERCGASFLVHPCAVRQGRGRFCSKPCHYASRADLETPIAERFWAGLRKTNGCWFWGKAKGRPLIQVRLPDGKKTMKLVARVAWELIRGPIPDGMEVCHNCPGGEDNPRCVNPAHLWLGTHADNMQDAATKGQMASGDRHPHVKISEEMTRKILAMLPLPHGGQHRLALELGVSDATISEIINGKRR